ncbi:ABC transporter ATP-binding protein [bacterium]|jgi:lipopolysaccharide transport system ATP-binding protein|nr:ABC transporter ATP-binding protein [bacterium]MBT4251260.1 ABC transporter ATP-binding protein [bacterium]MBT4598359.1 ABC transporter ATP-binding protein [bacterium]MBT6754192.1 ABC transporter ATP-binding protein [bacterium]MBT7038037.1 ABC transporter ATP-binding protein [bacterium]
MKKKKEKKEIVIKVENISKAFEIPHERNDTIRSVFVNIFKRKIFEKFKALDNISFEVKKGEFFGIIGRNGSGKSTLLKVLAGIYQQDAGTVQINGRISPFLELGIGFNPELSGRDNIYLNATVLGLTKKQIDEKFDSIVRFSELERFIDQKLKNYSSGMAVRLAFSVSIHANRDILLMDEVLAVGDSNFQSKCLSEFSRYRELGKTVILVTHSVEIVQRYCNKAMLLRNGKIVKIGKATEVADKYVFENMSDEERRLSKEMHKKEKGVKKTKEIGRKKAVEIKGIKFLDSYGVEKKVFKTGDDMSIRVYFKKYKDVPVLNFGLGIYSQEDFYFCGFSTIRDKVNTKDFVDKGYYQVDIKDIPFAENVFYLKLNIAGNDLGNYYDYVGRTKETFRVFVNKKNPGNVNLLYNWDKLKINR